MKFREIEKIFSQDSQPLELISLAVHFQLKNMVVPSLWNSSLSKLRVGGSSPSCLRAEFYSCLLLGSSSVGRTAVYRQSHRQYSPPYKFWRFHQKELLRTMDALVAGSSPAPPTNRGIAQLVEQVCYSFAI